MLRRGAASATSAVVTSSAVLCAPTEQRRGLKVRKENYFSREGVPHARRVSWAPHTTPKKQGAFAKLARSNFYDRRSLPMSQEPYNDEEIEAHRTYHRPDIYVYKYNVSPTHLSLRP